MLHRLALVFNLLVWVLVWVLVWGLLTRAWYAVPAGVITALVYVAVRRGGLRSGD